MTVSSRAEISNNAAQRGSLVPVALVVGTVTGALTMLLAAYLFR